MRIVNFVSAAFITVASATDMCTELCKHDGPQICTGGSWKKENGSCHGYLYRGNPSNKDYCYHTAATARSCPSNGVAVKADEVEGILNNVRRAVQAIPLDELVEIDSGANSVELRSGYLGHDFFNRHAGLYNFRNAKSFEKYAQVAKRWMLSNPNANLVQALMLLRNVATFPISAEVAVDSSWAHEGGISVDCKNRAGNKIAGFFSGRSAETDALIAQPDWRIRLCSLAYALHMELENRFDRI
jgi:hypothetical protein